MTTRRALLAALAAIVASPAAFARERSIFAPGGEIDAALEALASADRFSGVAAAAIGGTTIYARAFGQADRTRGIANTIGTRFNLASAGKMFTTVAIGQLLEARALSLDDHVAQHLPGLPGELGERITIAQLLTHTSGLGSYFASPLWREHGARVRSVEDYLAFVREERVPADYDGSYRYSNSGYILLGAIIEELRGRGYYDILQERIFTPANMTRTGFPFGDERADDLAICYSNGCFARPPNQCTPQPWASAPIIGRGGPAGGGVSTAGDMLAFVAALKGGALISATTLNHLKEERGRIDRPGGPIDAFATGFGRLGIHDQPSWGHNGGTIGAQAQVDILENEDLTLVVLCNQDGGQRPASAILRRSVVA